MIQPRRNAIRATLLALVAFALSAAGLPAAGSAATPSPHWTITSDSSPSHFTAGDTTGAGFYVLTATNTGGAPTDGSPITITDTLPAGASIHPGGGADNLATPFSAEDDAQHSIPCAPGSPATCTTSLVVPAGGRLNVYIPLDVAPGADGATLTNQVSISGGGAPMASATEQTLVGTDPAGFGLRRFSTDLLDDAGDPVTQAGSHPARFQVAFQFATDPVNDRVTPTLSPKDLTTTLPKGLVVNPQASPVLCTEAQVIANTCPDASAVGLAHTTIGLTGRLASEQSALYNVVPPPGSPAAFAFNAGGVGVNIHILGGVDPAGDYALTATVKDITQVGQASGVFIDLWGDPSDPVYDTRRGVCNKQGSLACPVASSDIPLLTMPSACSGPLETEISVNSWEQQADFITETAETEDESGTPIGVSGCSQLDFDPTLELQPTNTDADSPTGVDVSLKNPQTNDHDTLATSTLKRAVVTLPEGMTVNPSLADGLEACTTAQIGLISDSPIRFNAADPSCPDGSKVGTAEVFTPLLPEPIDGELFLADQDDNPFDALLSGYIVAQGQGVTIKLAGTFETDPDTGRIKATFDNNPQLPFTDFQLHFKGGPRGVLITPPTCGIYEIDSKFVAWSAADPNNPTPAEIVTSTDEFTVDAAPGGGPCVAGDPSEPGDPADRADLPFAPDLTAGAQTPLAGQHSPFVLRLTRNDGEQEITGLRADLPPGLTGKLAGIARCSEATINSIPTALGTGAGESANPSCPAASKVGYTNVGAGSGSQLTYIPGSVYLAGPYDPAGPDPQAPLSLAIVTPALAGPFDLGNVVVRTALYVDPDDAQLHAVSDPLPTILEGIPLHIRDIRVVMDRPGFTLNPTNCNPMSVTGQASGAGESLTAAGDNTTAALTDAFQVSGCGALGFSPKLSGSILNGQEGIHRSDHPNLLFNLQGTPGDANLSRVEVLLPQNFQIDQANLGNICSEANLIANDCAGKNTVGTASAITPLLDTPLSGPVYAVSGSGGLPKLAVILHGPPELPIKLVVRGITETEGARIKNTFPLVPDAPVSSFALNLKGGPTGYLVNNSNLCGTASKGNGKKKGKKSIASAAKKKGKKKKSKRRSTGIAADATFTGQNGDTLRQSVPITAECGGGKGKGKGKGKKGK